MINGYILTYGGFLLLGGRMADLLGRRSVLVTGLIVFAGSSLLGGLAHTSSLLIGARFAQGVGAAMMSPAALSTLTSTFRSTRDRNTALGVWAAVSGIGGAAGVLFGGLLTEGPGWRWVLFINVPFSALAFVGAFVLLKRERESRAAGELRRPRCLARDRRDAAARLHAGEGTGRRLGSRRARSPGSPSPP